MLSYLFVAKFANGREIRQNFEDVSTKIPDKSSFTDVLEEEKTGNKLVSFSLISQDGKHKIYTVDLIGGRFVLPSGHVSQVEGLELTNIRVIYFRENTISFNENLQQQGHDITYILGYQGNDSRGKNFKQTIKFC
ncbi:MAG: hypothetical protein AABY22_04690 [Nanoarchaeota archaeon]